MSNPSEPTPDGQVSETQSLDPAEAETPIADGDAVAAYPESESGSPQEPEPEAGPNADPHRDVDAY